jgi:hypothetical protein
MHFGIYCGCFIGLTYGALVVRKIRGNPSARLPAIYTGQSTRDVNFSWPAVPFMAAVGFMFGYTTFAWGFPWLYNKAFAPVVSKEVVVTGWEQASRGSCRRPEIGYNTFVIAPHALCARLEARERMVPGTWIRLVGPESILGMNVQEIYSLKRQPVRMEIPNLQQPMFPTSGPLYPNEIQR